MINEHTHTQILHLQIVQQELYQYGITAFARQPPTVALCKMREQIPTYIREYNLPYAKKASQSPVTGELRHCPF